jgi:hypothetical protein
MHPPQALFVLPNNFFQTCGHCHRKRNAAQVDERYFHRQSTLLSPPKYPTWDGHFELHYGCRGKILKQGGALWIENETRKTRSRGITTTAAPHVSVSEILQSLFCSVAMLAMCVRAHMELCTYVCVCSLILVFNSRTGYVKSATKFES